MEMILRGVAVYLFLMLVFKIAGKRSLSEVDTFDMVLLLIISETTQEALVGPNFSFTGAAIVITTLVGLEIGMGILRRRSRVVSKALDSTPLVILQDGKPFEERMRREGIEITDILSQARQDRGISRLDQIQYAILETSGQISILAKPGSEPAREPKAA
jgi:uncharacterized membrane protein YcaP (DUF421 family)